MPARRSAICLLLVLTSLLSLAPLAAQEELPSWTSIGPDGGKVQTLATSPALPNRIFAGLVGNGYGIFRSTDRGKSWSAAPDQLGRVVLDLAISADGSAMYAATRTGLLKSTDGGALWPVLEETTVPMYSLVATHPRRSGIVFAVRSGVLYRSGNGGVTRQAVAGPENVLALAFSSGSRTVAYAGGSNGLWKSTDDGRTWTSVDLGLGSTAPVQSIAVDPRNPKVLYAGAQLNRRFLFKSTDGGATWRQSQRGLPVTDGLVPIVTDIAVDLANSSIVYALLGNEIYRSVNAGRDWAPLPKLPGRLVADLEPAPFGLLAATRAGVFLSPDRGLTWQLRTSGMVATSITGMDIDHQEPARLYAADATVGIFKTPNQGRPWLRLGEIEGLIDWSRPVRVDPNDPQTVYAGSAFAVAKSRNGGRRWTLHGDLACNVTDKIFIDPQDSSHLFASGRFFTGGCGQVPGACIGFRSLDAGESWECIPGLPRLGIPLGVEPFSSAVYAFAGAGLWRSTDAGSTWSLLDEHLFAVSFAASPLVEGTLWIGQQGAVARSRDGGQTWQSFPTAPPGQGDDSDQYVTALAPDPVDPETLYAANRRGVLKSTDAGETWSPAGLWPPAIAFQGGLVIDPGDPAILYAGTDGLGVLRLDQSGN
jgi:photosystem II stability/assembly factor-like uncharacterized protein